MLFKKNIKQGNGNPVRYSNETKNKVIGYMLENPGRNISSVSQKFNIHPEYLRTWLKEQNLKEENNGRKQTKNLGS